MTMPMNTPANHELVTESFVFYHSFDQMIDHIPDEALQLETYKMICKYALYGAEPQSDNWLLHALFSAIKPQIDANNKRRANGKKGGRKPAQETAEAAVTTQPIQEITRPEAKAAEAISQPASVTPTAASTVTQAEAATELNMAELISQITTVVQAQLAAQTTPAMATETAAQEQSAVQAEAVVQAQSAVQAQPVMQAQPVIQAAPAMQTETSMQAQPAAQTESAVQVEPAAQVQPADRIVHFGENQYPTTPAELGRFEKFAYKLFAQYHDGKPTLADIERVLERTYTRIVRPDGEAIAVFDMYKGDLLDYAFEKAKNAGKLNWNYLDGMYRNFLVRGIETGAEARQYDLERAQRQV